MMMVRLFLLPFLPPTWLPDWPFCHWLGDLAPGNNLAAGGTVEAVRLTSELPQRSTDLRAGTILMREWNGRPQRAMVMERRRLLRNTR